MPTIGGEEQGPQMVGSSGSSAIFPAVWTLDDAGDGRWLLSGYDTERASIDGEPLVVRIEVTAQDAPGPAERIQRSEVMARELLWFVLHRAAQLENQDRTSGLPPLPGHPS